MAQENEHAPLQEQSYDIFLCTRGLPDALTPETAALRQLMSALAGSGYKVFFPSALPKDTPPEELAGAMAAAVRSVPVMIAAAVGEEGAADQTARFLWKRYRELGQETPNRRFIACVRDLKELPEELRDAEILDMSELRFLSDLGQKLAGWLPEAARRGEAEAEPTPEEPAPEESVPEEPAPEAPAAEESAAPPEPAPEAGKRRRRFLALAIGLAVLVILGVILLMVR